MTKTHTYQYKTQSRLKSDSESENLILSKFNEVEKGDSPCFFWGRLKNPYLLSRCLITLSNIVQSSFNLSPFHYNPATRKTEKVKYTSRFIKFKEVKPKLSLSDKLKKGFISKIDISHKLGIYNDIYVHQRENWFGMSSHDQLKTLFLTPNNPGQFLSEIVQVNMSSSEAWNEDIKRSLIINLGGLNSIWNRKDYNESTYLFLATSLLCNNKIARGLASEIFIKAVSEDNIDAKLLGEILGRLEHGQYGPLKRLTDLLLEIFNLSEKHSKALFDLMSSMVGQMNDEPIRGLKKMLELLLELKLNLPKRDLPQSAIYKVEKWNQVKSLNPITLKLMQ